MTRRQLTDDQWKLIDPFLPIGEYGPYPERLRDQFEGVIWRFGTGAQWREMPGEFGPWPTVYGRFRVWRNAGVFTALLEGLIAEAARQGKTDLSLVSVDSTTARAHHDTAGMLVTALSEHGAKAAYAALQGRVPWFGPSFFTKFLYLAGKSVMPANGPEPLVLDRFLARRLRSLARAVGRETGHAPDGSVAGWVWRDKDWSPHRYEVYPSFMHAAARQAAATDGWPSGALPDLLEYALFRAAWT